MLLLLRCLGAYVRFIYANQLPLGCLLVLHGIRFFSSVVVRANSDQVKKGQITQDRHYFGLHHQGRRNLEAWRGALFFLPLVGAHMRAAMNALRARKKNWHSFGRTESRHRRSRVHKTPGFVGQTRLVVGTCCRSVNWPYYAYPTSAIFDAGRKFGSGYSTSEANEK
ncbi:hypothetical protein BDZ94DRAFT_1275525 [Collybia nuda]|uniref:Uncharacterized protein n=1 Tax=Collybia nuda TaxID=64659 RepID=A0A9P5XTC3_9AGAR|nr:hypothetical protein BDZ94DRAFT_1275525 [Collybia nuda]